LVEIKPSGPLPEGQAYFVLHVLPPPGGFLMPKPRKNAPGFLDPGGAGRSKIRMVGAICSGCNWWNQ